MQRSIKELFGFKNELKWRMVILIPFYHLFGLYWCYHYAFPVKWQTVLFALISLVANAFGVLGGAHRLWSHKAYKVNLPLKLIILFCHAWSGQYSVEHWVRDHRVHHKYSDTAADPHDPSRGLFFAHIGWLMMKKNKLVIESGKKIDLSDMQNDPVLRFFNRHYLKFRVMIGFVWPTLLGVWLWDEDWRCAVGWQCFIRFLTSLHSILLINSVSHNFGYRPYKKTIRPTDNRIVNSFCFGEGWHNYHHSFPTDYRATENFDLFNTTTHLINFFHVIGWAYDLKTASPEIIKSVRERLGEDEQGKCNHMYCLPDVVTNEKTIMRKHYNN